MEGIGRKIIRNTLYNSAGFICLLLVNLLLTPYILGKLGNQLFAVWSLVFVVTSYLNLFDLGIGSSLSKFIAEYQAKEEESKLNSIINWGTLFYLGYSLVIFSIVCFSRGIILTFLKVPPALRDESTYALLGTVAIFCLSNIFRIFRETLNGFQRMDLLNRVTISGAILFGISAFVLLWKNQGIKGLVLAYGIQTGFLILGTVFYSLKIFPHLRFSLSFLRKESLNQMLKFGVKMQICGWANIVNLQSDKVILSYFIGLNSVTFYELGQKVALALRSLPLLAFSALVPTVSELEAKNDHEKLKELYRQGSKYIALSAFFLTFLTLLLAPYLIRIWVGPGYDLSSLTLQVFMLGAGINLLTGMGTSIVRGVGKPEYEVRYALLVMFMQLFLSIILVQKIGYMGVLFSSFFSTFLGSFYFLLIFHKLFAEDFFKFARDIYLKPLAGSLFAFICVSILNSYVKPLIGYSGILQNLALLFFDLLTFSSVLFGIVLKTKYIQSEDLKVFKLYFGVGESKVLK